MKRILLTGAAGFIGFHLCHRLTGEGYRVTGIDALLQTDDVWIKEIRLRNLSMLDNFEFYREKVRLSLLEKFRSDTECIIHLAAVSGIERFEKERKWAEKLTIEAALAVEEFARRYNIPVLFASSSSVYGNITGRRFSEQAVDLKPISGYAKTKLLTEDIFRKSSVSSLGLRFFTVYGEYGRPDMSYFRFADLISKNRAVQIFGKGIKRDFTYIDDLSNSVLLLMRKRNEIFSKYGKNLIINIGTGKTVPIEKIVHLIGRYLSKSPVIKYRRGKKYDLKYTCCDNRLLRRITGYAPDTEIEEGIERFVSWFRYVLPYELDPASHSRQEEYLFFVNSRYKSCP